MRSLVLVAVLGSIAHADVVGGELSAGGGGESRGTGYGVASVSGIAAIDREPKPLDQRGLAHCETSEGCLWIFTGLDPDEREGAGVRLDGVAMLRPDDERAIAAGEAWASKAGWKLTLRGDVQPVGTLRDAFWRSGRGIYQRNVRLDIAPMWSLGTFAHQLVVGSGHVALGERTLREGGTWQHAGFDRDFGLVGMRWQSKYHTLDLAEMRYLEWGVKTSERGGVTYGTSAGSIDVNASLRLRPIEQLELYGRVGFASYEPLSSFELHGTSQHSSGPLTANVTYWGEARLAAGGMRAVLGGGTWTRIDPTGHAVDHGHVGSVEIARAGDRLELTGSAQLGKLERILLGAMAMNVAGLHSRFVMGRAAIDASFRVMSSVRLGLTAWVERSDRDDPRWQTPSTGLLTTRAGADVSMTWRFARGTALE